MKVTWNPNTCCHAGVCVKSLPDVFKVEDGQFVIDPSKASDDEVRNVVNQCPSGALEIEEHGYELTTGRQIQLLN